MGLNEVLQLIGVSALVFGGIIAFLIRNAKEITKTRAEGVANEKATKNLADALAKVALTISKLQEEMTRHHENTTVHRNKDFEDKIETFAKNLETFAKENRADHSAIIAEIRKSGK